MAGRVERPDTEAAPPRHRHYLADDRRYADDDVAVAHLRHLLVSGIGRVLSHRPGGSTYERMALTAPNRIVGRIGDGRGRNGRGKLRGRRVGAPVGRTPVSRGDGGRRRARRLRGPPALPGPEPRIRPCRTAVRRPAVRPSADAGPAFPLEVGTRHRQGPARHLAVRWPSSPRVAGPAWHDGHAKLDPLPRIVGTSRDGGPIPPTQGDMIHTRSDQRHPCISFRYIGTG